MNVDWKAIEALGIRRLTNDSRQVRPGATFVAWPGGTSDGRAHIGEAIARGAAHVLWEARGFRWRSAWRVPNVGVPDLRRHAGAIASRLHGAPGSRLWMVGVTGTNGKTTCSQWIAQALTRAGRRCAVIGTLGYGLRPPLKPLANTTPDALWLHARLAEFARRGAQAVAMEVSSIGLDQHRVAGVDFDVALFTNLTRDHLEYHATMRRYREAKARLFAWESLRHAVVNVDDDFGRELARSVRRPGLAVIGYGFGKARATRALCVTGSDLVTGPQGVRFAVDTPWGAARVASSTLGRHNAYNLLATLAVLLASGVKLRAAVAALAELKAVPGRMERLGGGAQPLIVVDYAHTPDALEHALTTLRDVITSSGFRVPDFRLSKSKTVRENSKLETPNPKLTCVFGCGGERDRGKRRQMGRLAARLADRVIVTSDNPRGENPQRIIADILAGVAGCGEELAVIPDRRSAVQYAVASARRGDVVLLAGKGHEAYQLVAGVRRPFSDVAEARRALKGGGMSGGAGAPRKGMRPAKDAGPPTAGCRVTAVAAEAAR
ncbi:MAG TPA: UDP-N-acetylmuramoyl-L-alanyl-D-glutamate--2,6-diaminopimelate ligase [Burkholderiales bacterium]|nr:UDP-N-acetylmuramoyl-L-alanyl-D-glutamate--2,6-diaminopimelate ligase [Burkholderiales bacterium]